jgi:hypothetical protein
LGNQHTNGVKHEDPVICPRSKAVPTNPDYVAWRAQFEMTRRGLSLEDLEVKVEGCDQTASAGAA